MRLKGAHECRLYWGICIAFKKNIHSLHPSPETIKKLNSLLSEAPGQLILIMVILQSSFWKKVLEPGWVYMGGLSQDKDLGQMMLCYAKSLESCPTLCDPIDGSPTGSPVSGILQARTLESVAISFSNAWKWKVKVKSLSRVQPSATPWTAALQAPPSMGFSRQVGQMRWCPNIAYIYRLIYIYMYTQKCHMNIYLDMEGGN